MPASAFQGLADRIDAALPQTQCTRCGYPDCAAYAQAIAAGAAPINQCPPGGAEGIARLAAITGQPVLPLSTEHGVESPRTLAVIDENWCIGCTLCIKACPTDAIFGANKLMHTVIAPHCTGCELCIPVCPVDCITLIPASGGATGWDAWSPPQARHALERYTRRQHRLGGSERAAAPKAAMAAGLEVALAPTAALSAVPETAVDAKKAAIAAAMARARAQRGQP
jgi:electron transport complex protein RnfB